jgi:hypothetical protein
MACGLGEGFELLRGTTALTFLLGGLSRQMEFDWGLEAELEGVTGMEVFVE